MGQLNLAAGTVEKLAAAIVAGMINEAAHRGASVTAAEIAQTIAADPNGETASYFIRAAVGSLEWIANFRANPELLEAFGGAA